MVTNEFFKSIARTLGRIAAYIILGILAYFIFTWFNADQVKAATITPSTISYYGVDSNDQSIYVTNTSTNTYTIFQAIGMYKYINGTEMVFPVSVVSGNTYFIEWEITYVLAHEDGSYNPTIAYTLNNISTTCDTTIEQSIVQTSAATQNYTYKHKYKCSFNSTINGTSFYFNYYTGKRQTIKSFTINFNLYRDDLTNADIIENSNYNTERTMINANENAQKIVNSINNMIAKGNELLHSQGQTQQAVYDNTQAVEIMDSHLTSESNADISLLSPINDLMPSNTPITDIITLPINILNKEIQSLGGTCQAWTINTGSLLGNNTWTFPCINISQYFTGYSYSGFNLWQLIDLMICLYMGYEILMLIVSAYNSIANLDDPFSDLYKPKHEGYAMKHGEGRL